MVTKKDLVIAVLATFCLTATIFMVIPTRSQQDRYDPWADYDEDGRVNIVDISRVASAFGTSGDPAKSVIIVGHASKYFNVVPTLQLDQFWYSDPILVDGYLKFTISFVCTNGNLTYKLYVSNRGEAYTWLQVDEIENTKTSVKTYEVVSRYIQVVLSAVQVDGTSAFLDFYLVA